MEIRAYNIPRSKLEKIPKVEFEEIFKYEVADITVECPNCRLQYEDTLNDDESHYIECDRCGKIYYYKMNW